jgi:hypothetical protein
MIRLRHLLAFGTLLLAAPAVVPQADGPSEARGEVGLALMLRKLATTGTVFHATAHPDDENNGLLAMQSHGEGCASCSARPRAATGARTRSAPSCSRRSACCAPRSSRRRTGSTAPSSCSRAPSTSASRSASRRRSSEWGADEMLVRLRRLIRMTRPDIIVTMRPDGPGRRAASPDLGAHRDRGVPRGGRSRPLSRTGRRGAAAMAAAEGVPDRPLRFLPGRAEARRHRRPAPVDVEVYDPLLGRTYAEIGSEARAMHKCQGFGQLLALPGSFTVRYRLANTTLPGGTARRETSMTDGLDLSLSGLAAFAGTEPPSRLVGGLRDIAGAVAAADRALRTSGANAAIAPLTSGLCEHARVLGVAHHAHAVGDDGGVRDRLPPAPDRAEIRRRARARAGAPHRDAGRRRGRWCRGSRSR